MLKILVISLVAGVGLIISRAVIAQQAGSDLRPSQPLMPDNRKNQDDQLRALLQHDLSVSDDEMAVIWPRFQAIVAARNPVAAALGTLAKIPGRSVSPPSPITELRKAAVELSQAEKGQAATSDQLADKMEAVRELRRKDLADLQAAREGLRKIVDTRKEAMLMIWGILN